MKVVVVVNVGVGIRVVVMGVDLNCVIEGEGGSVR